MTDLVPFGVDRKELLTLAGAVEQSSEHPLAQAISSYAQREGARAPPTRNFRATPGKGVTSRVNGTEVAAGKPSFLEELGIRISDRVRAAL